MDASSVSCLNGIRPSLMRLIAAFLAVTAAGLARAQAAETVLYRFKGAEDGGGSAQMAWFYHGVDTLFAIKPLAKPGILAPNYIRSVPPAELIALIVQGLCRPLRVQAVILSLAYRYLRCSEPPVRKVMGAG